MFRFEFFLSVFAPPPVSTLFPYTTLFRSAPAVGAQSMVDPQTQPLEDQPASIRFRSVKQTAELQSLRHIAYRLMLEKSSRPELIAAGQRGIDVLQVLAQRRRQVPRVVMPP